MSFISIVNCFICRNHGPINLRSSKDIKGITVTLDEKTHSIKIPQLADDTTLFCNSKGDVLKAMNEIEIFGSFSGLLLNRNKREGVWIGKLKIVNTKLLESIGQISRLNH